MASDNVKKITAIHNPYEFEGSRAQQQWQGWVNGPQRRLDVRPCRLHAGKHVMVMVGVLVVLVRSWVLGRKC